MPASIERNRTPAELEVSRASTFPCSAGKDRYYWSTAPVPVRTSLAFVPRLLLVLPFVQAVPLPVFGQPVISSISPDSAPPLTIVHIAGSNLLSEDVMVHVIHDADAYEILPLVVTSNGIEFFVPLVSYGSASVSVFVNETESNNLPFTIENLPDAGEIAGDVTIAAIDDLLIVLQENVDGIGQGTSACSFDGPGTAMERFDACVDLIESLVTPLPEEPPLGPADSYSTFLELFPVLREAIDELTSDEKELLDQILLLTEMSQELDLAASAYGNRLRQDLLEYRSTPSWRCTAADASSILNGFSPLAGFISAAGQGIGLGGDIIDQGPPVNGTEAFLKKLEKIQRMLGALSAATAFLQVVDAIIDKNIINVDLDPPGPIELGNGFCGEAFLLWADFANDCFIDSSRCELGLSTLIGAVPIPPVCFPWSWAQWTVSLAVDALGLGITLNPTVTTGVEIDAEAASWVAAPLPFFISGSGVVMTTGPGDGSLAAEIECGPRTESAFALLSVIVEECDGIDNNCNGMIDNADPSLQLPPAPNDCVEMECIDGAVVATPKPEGTACPDVNQCTTGQCNSDGVCGPGAHKASGTHCNDSNPCTIEDECDGLGQCIGAPKCPIGDPSGQCCLLAGCTSGACISDSSHDELCPPGERCQSDCTCVPRPCGDGVVEPPEECESDADCAEGEQCRFDCMCATSIPAVSEWGLAALTLLGMCVGTVVLLRGRSERWAAA